MKNINPHKFTFGPTKYSWAIENRLDDIVDIKLQKTVKRKLSSVFHDFCSYVKYIEVIEDCIAKKFFKHAMYREFYNRLYSVVCLDQVDSSIRENFIKVIKSRIKEIK